MQLKQKGVRERKDYGVCSAERDGVTGCEDLDLSPPVGIGRPNAEFNAFSPVRQLNARGVLSPYQSIFLKICK